MQKKLVDVNKNIQLVTVSLYRRVWEPGHWTAGGAEEY
jgi:hypothetical protein